MRGAIGLKITLRHFERGARDVDARDLAADLGEMQRESALVAADIERAAPVRIAPQALRPVARGGVVGALVEECAGLLAGVGVVVEGEAVEMELRARPRAVPGRQATEDRGWARAGPPTRECADRDAREWRPAQAPRAGHARRFRARLRRAGPWQGTAE